MAYNERIDKIIASFGVLSRRDVKSAALKGRITINGKTVKDTSQKVTDTDLLCLDGKAITYEPFLYIMMNKPTGYVSSNDQPGQPCVFDLVTQAERNRGLFCVGRLDKDTVGLIILTNDGDAAHQLLSPKKHVEKSYYFECADSIGDADVASIENGLTLADGFTTKNAKLELDFNRKSGIITITEGKYHQIKRMFGAIGNKITFLERRQFANLTLDSTLERGQWRILYEHERDILLQNVIRS